MLKNNKKEFKIVLNKLKVIIVAFITISGWAFGLYPLIPRHEMKINYNQNASVPYFWIRNTGNTILHDVKTNYEITCQNLVSNIMPINSTYTDLGPDDPPPLQFLDNFTASVVKSSEILGANCFGYLGYNYYCFGLGPNITANFSAEKYFCDRCNLLINTISNETKQSFSKSFILPLKTLITVNCTNIFLSGKYIKGECVFSFSNATNFYIPNRNVTPTIYGYKSGEMVICYNITSAKS